MLKALIPVELNLACNIALRYVCRKPVLFDMGLQPIHVEEPDQKAHSAQTGWIRKTWESGLQQAGREEVQRILSTEVLEDCFVLPQPIIKVGDRDEMILQELLMGSYDLYIEGAVSNFNTGEFRNLLRSKLYKRMPCPALLVKNLIKPERILLLLDRKSDLERVSSQFGKYFTDPQTKFDVCAYELDEKHQDSTPEQLLAEFRELLETQGRTPSQELILRGAPEGVAEQLRGYGLLVSYVDRKSNRKSPLTDVLCLVPCPLFLCW